MPDSGNWSVFTFFGYTAAVFLLAIFSHRLLKGRGFVKEYFLGSRGLGVWALAMSYAATSASGGSFTGFPAKIYEHGWILALWISSYMVVPLCCMGILGKRLNQVARKTGAITVPDILRDRFRSPRLGILLSLILAFFLAFNLVAQFKAGGFILDELLKDQGWFQSAAEAMRWIPDTLYLLGDPAGAPTPTYALGLLFFASGVIIYTAYGGFRAVVWTDVLQGIVMFVGVLILLPLAISAAGGLGAATEGLARKPTPRLGEVLVDAPQQGAITIPEATVVTITREGTPFSFETVRTVVVESDGDVPTVVVRAKDPSLIPASAWEGPGTEVALSVESGPAPAVRSYLVAPPRNLVSGPGPHATRTEGFLPWSLVISFFIMWAIVGVGQPGTLVRLMAFKDTKVYRRSIFTVTFYYSLLYLPLVIIFVCARNIIDLDEPDKAMPKLVIAIAHPALAGVLLAAPFAAIMSTVDSFLLMISSSLVRDIYQRSVNPAASETRIRRLSYATTVLVGVVVTFGALNPPTYLQDIIIFTSAGLASCFLAPMVYGLFWKRATEQGIIASILGGFVALMVLYAINWIRLGSIAPFNLAGFLPVVWGLGSSFVCGYVGSRLSPPPPRDLVRFYFSAPKSSSK